MRLIQLLLAIVIVLLLWGPVSNYFGTLNQHTLALQGHEKRLVNIEQFLTNLKVPNAASSSDRPKSRRH